MPNGFLKSCGRSFRQRTCPQECQRFRSSRRHAGRSAAWCNRASGVDPRDPPVRLLFLRWPADCRANPPQQWVIHPFLLQSQSSHPLWSSGQVVLDF